MGIATAGVNLATSNIGLKLAPSGKATSYLASASLFAALAAGIAPLIGGITAEFFQGWAYFFLIAFVIGIYSLHRLSLVSEEGEVGDRAAVKEFVSEMRVGVKAGVSRLPKPNARMHFHSSKRSKSGLISVLVSLHWK